MSRDEMGISLYCYGMVPESVGEQYSWCLQVDMSDGKIFTTMEWLMVFVKVPL